MGAGACTVGAVSRRVLSRSRTFLDMLRRSQAAPCQDRGKRQAWHLHGQQGCAGCVNKARSGCAVPGQGSRRGDLQRQTLATCRLACASRTRPRVNNSRPPRLRRTSTSPSRWPSPWPPCGGRRHQSIGLSLPPNPPRGRSLQAPSHRRQAAAERTRPATRRPPQPHARSNLRSWRPIVTCLRQRPAQRHTPRPWWLTEASPTTPQCARQHTAARLRQVQSLSAHTRTRRRAARRRRRPQLVGRWSALRASSQTTVARRTCRPRLQLMRTCRQRSEARGAPPCRGI